jgi:hypothetical protein
MFRALICTSSRPGAVRDGPGREPNGAQARMLPTESPPANDHVGLRIRICRAKCTLFGMIRRLGASTAPTRPARHPGIVDCSGRRSPALPVCGRWPGPPSAWSPMMAADSWQWTATEAAVTCHLSALTLEELLPGTSGRQCANPREVVRVEHHPQVGCVGLRRAGSHRPDARHARCAGFHAARSRPAFWACGALRPVRAVRRRGDVRMGHVTDDGRRLATMAGELRAPAGRHRRVARCTEREGRVTGCGWFLPS